MSFRPRFKGPPQNKYGNSRCIVTPDLMILTAADLARGIIARTKSDLNFQSLREAKRYVYLKQLEKQGLIRNLRMQVPFKLTTRNKEGLDVLVSTYRADFVFERDGVEVVEDSKGMKTETYLLKKKWVFLQHGIEIQEV